MAKLIYSAIMSIDGYVADREGSFEWAAPDDEVHAFINDLERPIGTYLYGRRMYEVMAAWESLPLSGQPPVARDFAEIWRAADKVVYSRTVNEVSSARTRIERSFEPETIKQLKARASRALSVGGPNLAGQAIEAGLVDEYHFFLQPFVVGGGLACLPSGVRLRLELLDQHRFSSGTVHLHYGNSA
jgi:dihydrofolate reductase